MRILVIEDDPGVVALVTRQLTAMEFLVEAAVDGPSGLAAGMTGHHDALIVDLVLPGFDGFELIMRLRQEGIRAPILVLSGLSQLEDIVRALDAGADDYLIKPYRAEELAARLRAIHRRGGSRPPDWLECGPLRYDRSTHEVTLDGQPVELTGKELELLEQLLVSAGRIVRRTDLFATLWDPDTSSGSNVLDVHIGHLRRKLARLGTPLRLDTIRGVGFRLYLPPQRAWNATGDPSPDPLVEPPRPDGD